MNIKHLLPAAVFMAASVLNAADQPPSDLVKVKAARLSEIQKRLTDDKTLSAEDRANLEKLVARLQAELKSNESAAASQTQSKLD